MRLLLACCCVLPASSLRASEPQPPRSPAAKRERLARGAEAVVHLAVCGAMLQGPAESVRTDEWACTRLAPERQGMRSVIMRRRRRAAKVGQIIGTGYTPRIVFLAGLMLRSLQAFTAPSSPPLAPPPQRHRPLRRHHLHRPPRLRLAAALDRWRPRCATCSTRRSATLRERRSPRPFQGASGCRASCSVGAPAVATGASSASGRRARRARPSGSSSSFGCWWCLLVFVGPFGVRIRSARLFLTSRPPANRKTAPWAAELHP